MGWSYAAVVLTVKNKKKEKGSYRTNLVLLVFLVQKSIAKTATVLEEQRQTQRYTIQIEADQRDRNGWDATFYH